MKDDTLLKVISAVEWLFVGLFYVLVFVNSSVCHNSLKNCKNPDIINDKDYIERKRINITSFVFNTVSLFLVLMMAVKNLNETNNWCVDELIISTFNETNKILIGVVFLFLVLCSVFSYLTITQAKNNSKECSAYMTFKKLPDNATEEDYIMYFDKERAEDYKSVENTSRQLFWFMIFGAPLITVLVIFFIYKYKPLSIPKPVRNND